MSARVRDCEVYLSEMPQGLWVTYRMGEASLYCIIILSPSTFHLRHAGPVSIPSRPSIQRNNFGGTYRYITEPLVSQLCPGKYV